MAMKSNNSPLFLSSWPSSSSARSSSCARTMHRPLRPWQPPPCQKQQAQMRTHPARRWPRWSRPTRTCEQIFRKCSVLTRTSASAWNAWRKVHLQAPLLLVLSVVPANDTDPAPIDVFKPIGDAIDSVTGLGSNGAGGGHRPVGGSQDLGLSGGSTAYKVVPPMGYTTETTQHQGKTVTRYVRVAPDGTQSMPSAVSAARPHKLLRPLRRLRSRNPWLISRCRRTPRWRASPR